jgi:hypothetical protein
VRDAADGRAADLGLVLFVLLLFQVRDEIAHAVVAGPFRDAGGGGVGAGRDQVADHGHTSDHQARGQGQQEQPAHRSGERVVPPDGRDPHGHR